MTGDDEFALAQMTWEEAEASLDRADFVALPCGATEQHSRHLPLSVDTIRAKELTRELASAAPTYDLEILTLPALPYGYSENHMHFAGTVTVSPHTYEELVVDIGRSMAAHGAAQFMLVNAHFGNENALQFATDRLQRHHDLPTHYVRWAAFATDLFEERWGDDWGHAGPHETSMIEHYRPELVRSDRKSPPTVRPGSDTRKFAYFDEITDEGATADPTKADPEFVEEVIETTTDRILESLRQDLDRNQ